MKTSARVLLVSFFGVAAAAGWVYSRNALFRLTEVAVDSPDADVSAIIRRRLMGILGRSLFTVSLSDLQRQIGVVPQVENVTLHRRWPSTLGVQVQIKRPVACLFIKGKLWTLDGEGHPIELLTKPTVLPLLKSLPSRTEERTELFAWLRDRADTSALEMDRIDTLAWTEDRGLVATLAEPEGLEIELGYREFARSWVRADRAWALLRRRPVKVELLDATYRHRVVARVRGNLQNPGTGLNLKELVRRTGAGTAPEGSPSAR